MALRRLRMFRRLACDCRATNGSLAAIVALALLVVSEVSAQNDPSPRSIYSTWTKRCSKDGDPNARCFTASDVFIAGEHIVTVGILETVSGPAKFFYLSTAKGVGFKHGTQLMVDGNKPLVAQDGFYPSYLSFYPPYLTCEPPAMPADGCIAHYQATPDLIERMKTGEILTFMVIDKDGEPINVKINLQYFARAYDGPPMEPSAIVEQQRRLQTDSQKPVRDDTLQRHLRPRN